MLYACIRKLLRTEVLHICFVWHIANVSEMHLVVTGFDTLTDSKFQNVSPSVATKKLQKGFDKDWKQVVRDWEKARS